MVKRRFCYFPFWQSDTNGIPKNNIYEKHICIYIFFQHISEGHTVMKHSNSMQGFTFLFVFCEQFFYNMLNNLKSLKFFLVKKWFLTKGFLARARPRPTLLVLSLETFKVVTRLAGPSSQVSPTERQGPEFTSFHKTTTIPKIITNMSLIKPSHIERAVKFVSS